MLLGARYVVRLAHVEELENQSWKFRVRKLRRTAEKLTVGSGKPLKHDPTAACLMISPGFYPINRTSCPTFPFDIGTRRMVSLLSRWRVYDWNKPHTSWRLWDFPSWVLGLLDLEDLEQPPSDSDLLIKLMKVFLNPCSGRLVDRWRCAGAFVATRTLESYWKISTILETRQLFLFLYPDDLEASGDLHPILVGLPGLSLVAVRTGCRWEIWCPSRLSRPAPPRTWIYLNRAPDQGASHGDGLLKTVCPTVFSLAKEIVLDPIANVAAKLSTEVG